MWPVFCAIREYKLCVFKSSMYPVAQLSLFLQKVHSSPAGLRMKERDGGEIEKGKDLFCTYSAFTASLGLRSLMSL